MENPESETTSVSFVAGTSNFDVTPPASGLQQTIQNISAGFTAGGIQIDPFIMKIVKGAASDVWQNRIGTTPIAFMRINADGNFKPLGDYAIVGSPMTASRVENFASYLFSAVAGREDALMPPVSATWILDTQSTRWICCTWYCNNQQRHTAGLEQLLVCKVRVYRSFARFVCPDILERQGAELASF
jgi:hypothetical protein